MVLELLGAFSLWRLPPTHQKRSEWCWCAAAGPVGKIASMRSSGWLPSELVSGPGSSRAPHGRRTFAEAPATPIAGTPTPPRYNPRPHRSIR